MKFAHFSHVWGKPSMTPASRYEQLWREIELCDNLNFDYAFCVEHHFRPDESWMSAPSLFSVAAGVKTKKIRLGPMGYVVPLYNSLRLAEEIAIIDQMLDGRLELGLVPGINPIYFEPFGLKYDDRKEPTLEYVDYLRKAFSEKQPFTYEGKHHKTANAKLAVQPVQKPHPPLWMQSRDPKTLEFCARNGINTGYFLIYPRNVAAIRYKKYFEDWKAAGWNSKPKIAYSTVVYVDETDKKAKDIGLERAAKAYEGLLEPPSTGSFENRVKRFVKRANTRNENEAAKLMANLFNPEFLISNDLIFIGSPDTVAKKLKKASLEGHFNTFMGEFNFSNLPENDLMRSIKLFGQEVIPQLKGFEPF